jgi:hypothetical protein
VGGNWWFLCRFPGLAHVWRCRHNLARLRGHFSVETSRPIGGSNTNTKSQSTVTDQQSRAGKALITFGLEISPIYRLTASPNHPRRNPSSTSIHKTPPSRLSKKFRAAGDICSSSPRCLPKSSKISTALVGRPPTSLQSARTASQTIHMFR